MNRIIGEIGREPLPRAEWESSCDQSECDCATCPARAEMVMQDERSGNALSAMLACLIIGIGIGIAIGALLP